MKPTVEAVSLLLRTRTVGDSAGGLGGDTSPVPVTAFTASTRPTADEVQGIIDLAWPLVQAQLPELPEDHAGLGTLGTIYAGMLVETSFFRESVRDDDALSKLYAAALSGLGDLGDEPGQGIPGRATFAALPLGTAGNPTGLA